ncbi:Remorin C-terminal [Arabidopsis thaliana x Arabidopsis arenosa]|uniref:Remorin C-terminal n=1 Tax=Arabidopsis thaliana x Arabidopsis arenosa TaxID=1240361 RepID=A0A8T2BGE3_9BRAS|nr:Remorin C-terminal [Arabidopsis thaliana x Arabidopsis arenosa]
MNETREQRAKPVPMAAVVDQWKETELSKSRNKYEKLSEKIMSWEDKKRKKAKRKLHRTERNVEKTKLKAVQRFRDENERIEIIVASARAHAYESRMKEELKVKQKANLMRTTGRKPSACL